MAAKSKLPVDDKFTVVVVGAGASKPYGLPLGRELRDLVLRIPANDPTLKLLSRFSVSQESFRDFRTDLQMSAISTVDGFLEKRPNWMKVGKIAMAIALDGKESEEKLFPPNHPKDHWLESFWQSLNCTSWAALKRKKLRVVSFNYDRTLECYLCGVISNNLRVSRSKAAEWLTKEFVVHPHGTLGTYEGERLHWMSFDRPDQYQRIKKALENIIVISEANPRTTSFASARRLLTNSKNYVFLGFGYHAQNMKRLGFPDICKNSPKSIYASNKGIAKYEWWQICKYDLNSPHLKDTRWPSLSRLVASAVG